MLNREKCLKTKIKLFYFIMLLIHNFPKQFLKVAWFEADLEDGSGDTWVNATSPPIVGLKTDLHPVLYSGQWTPVLFLAVYLLTVAGKDC